MNSGRSYNITTSPCPHCGHEMDSTFCTHGNIKPRVGDASLCIQCGGISLFTKEIGLRKPTDREEKELSMKPEVITAQILIRGRKR